MTWYFKEKEFTSEDIGDNFGFIYQITDKQSNRKYIGRKSFFLYIKQGKLKVRKRNILLNLTGRNIPALVQNLMPI